MLSCYLSEGLEREARALSESKNCENYSGHRERLLLHAAQILSIKMSARVVLVVRENFVGLETHLAETFARLIDHLF